MVTARPQNIAVSANDKLKKTIIWKNTSSILGIWEGRERLECFLLDVCVCVDCTVYCRDL